MSTLERKTSKAYHFFNEAAESNRIFSLQEIADATSWRNGWQDGGPLVSYDIQLVRTKNTFPETDYCPPLYPKIMCVLKCLQNGRKHYQFRMAKKVPKVWCLVVPVVMWQFSEVPAQVPGTFTSSGVGTARISQTTQRNNHTILRKIVLVRLGIQDGYC